MGKLGTFVARVASLAGQIGKDIKSLRENKIPFTGADKAVDLNTQSLTHEGNFVKREGQFESKYLANSSGTVSHFRKYTDVASLSRPSDNTTIGDILITLPINNTTAWSSEVTIREGSSQNEAILVLSAYSTSNTRPKVSLLKGGDWISSVKFGRLGNSTILIIKRSTGASSFTYGKVNIDKFLTSFSYSTGQDDKSNYKIEFIKEEDISGLTINATILNKDFERDPYLLDFRNFTNVPNFAQASNVYTKSEALDRFIPRVGDADVDGTKRFLQAPIIPKGTLDSHAVNKGQVDGMLGGYIPRDSDVGIPVESLLAFMKPIIVPEATVNEHAVNKGQVIEMQGVYRDSKGNVLTKHILDNPDKYNISGERNVILALNTVHDSPVNVSSNDSFLHGLDHSMLGNRSAAFGVGHIVTGHHSAAFGFGNSIKGSDSAAFGFGNSVEGEYSFAANFRNTTNFTYESAFGAYNKSYRNYDITNGVIPDALRFSIGIGIYKDGNETRMNAVSVFKNGETWFDELTPTKIENSKSNKVAITKEYLNLRVPKPPTFGNHVLKVIGGAVQWVAE